MNDQIAEPITRAGQPTTPGWYRSTEGSYYMIYLLNGNLDWYAITMSGDITKCVWDFIEQCGPLEALLTVSKKQDLLKGVAMSYESLEPFKKQAEEVRRGNGEIVQLCVVEELDLLAGEKAEAVSTFGGFSLCREHFDDVVHLIRSGTPMGEVVHMMMTDGLNPVIEAEEL